MAQRDSGRSVTVLSHFEAVEPHSLQLILIRLLWFKSSFDTI